MLPDKFISVRQPWAWALIHGGKDVENRTQNWKYRGRVGIHAAQNLGFKDYEYARDFILKGTGIIVPRPDDLIRGAIIGSVEFTGCVNDSDSPWFMGPYGITCKDPQPYTPQGRTRGALGLFPNKETKEPLLAPSQWMKNWQPSKQEI